MSSSVAGGWFGAIQLEVPWPLGPADGRHVLRDADAAISHIVVLETIGAVRRGRSARRRSRELAGDPGAPALTCARATVILAGSSLGDEAAARAWLTEAGDALLEERLAAGLGALGRLLHAHRLAAADPVTAVVTRDRLVAARLGYGDGETVALGRLSRARELAPGDGPGARARSPRRRGSTDEGSLAALLSGARPALVCEELVLRTRLDLDSGRPREAALGLLVALDAALVELGARGAGAAGGGAGADPGTTSLSSRVADLRDRRDAVAGAAQAALAGTPSVAEQAEVAEAVARLEAALRARAAAIASGAASDR